VAAEPQVYELLAQALIYPDDAFAAKVAGRARALSASAPWAKALVEALDGVVLEDLQTEHVRLFVNAFGGAPCLPYESVYAEGQVMGQAARDLAALYTEWGVQETGEMPDHAAVELAFAAQLARLRLLPELGEEREAVRQTLEVFGRDHLRGWLPRLGADLQVAADLAFYRALGDALLAVFGAGEAAGRTGRRAAPGDLYLDTPA
jgi:putative dimethyl sulfoxide reductase chaperone